MTMSLDIDKGVSASCDSEGRSTLVSPVVALEDASGAAASPPKVVTGSGGGVLKLQKKTAGRKPPVVAPAGTPAVRASVPVQRPVVMALASPGGPAGDTPSVISPPPPDALRVEVAKVAPIPTARRSKAVASAPTQERMSSRPKGAKGNIPSLQRAQLLQAQKNLEIEAMGIAGKTTGL
ncbi:uncharacterized protein [Triticum aestivum]|uniref:uncharacterized protein n=1 Tax=Triticum aestivum TaxID=4565 RepID=UPI001D008A2C|nr:uncharacterized protein LOC123158110 [Triticum aestivum]